MKIGDLVKVKQKYSEWGYGVGILLGTTSSGRECRVLLGETVVLFMKYELELANEYR